MSSLFAYFIRCIETLEFWNPSPFLDDILSAILSVYGNGTDNELMRDTDSDSDSDSDSESYYHLNPEIDLLDSDSDSDSDSESEYLGDSQIYPFGLSYYLSSEEEEEEEEEYDEFCNPRIVSIEGNIGAGKTTLIRKLQEKYKHRTDILFLEEPLAIWETFQDPNDGSSILEKFYNNPSKYAFPFQILAFQSRYEMIHRAVQNARLDTSCRIKTIVLERSLDADYHIFAKRLVADGVMEKIAFDIYFYTVRERLAEYGSSGIIWLDVEPEECYRRVQGRGREGEEGMSLGYLRGCDEAHQEWLSADTGFVLRLDGSASSSEKIMEDIDMYLF